MTGIEGSDMIERERVVGIPRALTAGPHVEREMEKRMERERGPLTFCT